MDKNEIVKRILDKRKRVLLRALEKAKEERDNAPGAMESHSDTTRSQSEKLMSALEQQLKELDETVKEVGSGNKSFPVKEITFNGEKKKFILVPEGLGGEEIGGVRLLSEESPLGLQLANKKAGDKFEFNSKQVIILT